VCPGGEVARSQDYSKVIAILARLETTLKGKIDREEKERRDDVAALNAKIDSLRERGETPAPIAPGPVRPSTRGHSPEALDPVARLKSGNDRFVAGSASTKDLPQDRADVIAGQHPFAIVLTCADSRVPPELIFDQTLGQLFVVRDAGNVVDSVILGSIEYAAEHLHTRLLVVLGHQSCGAVKATIAGGDAPPNIGSLLRRVAPAVLRMREAGTSAPDLLDASIEENVRLQIARAEGGSHVLAELIEKKEFDIVGAIYNLESGRVTFVQPSQHR
jgi:carbonic anhydrase